MTDNIITVSTQDKGSTKITVSSSGTSGNINVTADTAEYWSRKSKEWAISDEIVDREDYSSKWWAKQSKESATSVKESAEYVKETVEGFNDTVNNAKQEIEEAKVTAILDVSAEGKIQSDKIKEQSENIEETISQGLIDISQSKDDALGSIQREHDKSILDIEEAKNNAKEDLTSGIDEAKQNAIDEINKVGTEKLEDINNALDKAEKTIDELEQEGNKQVQRVIDEGDTQVERVKSTGFWMEDGKLYYYDENGDIQEFKSSSIDEYIYVNEDKDNIYIKCQAPVYYADGFTYLPNPGLADRTNMSFNNELEQYIGKFLYIVYPVKLLKDNLSIVNKENISDLTFGDFITIITKVFNEQVEQEIPCNQGYICDVDFNPINLTAKNIVTDVLETYPATFIYAIKGELEHGSIYADISKYQHELRCNVADYDSKWFTTRTRKIKITDAIEELYSQVEELEEKTKKTGGGLEIGDIGIAPLGIDETKGLRRYLNGSIMNVNANTQAFTDKLISTSKLYPSLLCTDKEWQAISSKSVGGQCGKFVIDEEKSTIRLPKIIMPIQGLSDFSKLGEISQNGFLDFSGDIANEQIQYPYFIQIATGVEYEVNIKNDIELNNPFTLLEYKYSEIELDSISWLKSTGQYNPKAIYADAYNKILENVNKGLKKFKSNMAYAFNGSINCWFPVEKPVVGAWAYSTTNGEPIGQVEQVNDNGSLVVNGQTVTFTGGGEAGTSLFTDYDFIINTKDETFRLPIKTRTLPLDGTIPVYPMNIPNKKIPEATTMTFNTNSGTISSERYIGTHIDGSSGKALLTSYSSSSATGGNYIYLYPNNLFADLSSAENPNVYLYFYVGETVQNANLIDAGRLSEELADKLSRNNKTEIISWGIPDYTSSITIGSSANTTFIAPTAGFIKFNYSHTLNTGVNFAININGVTVSRFAGYNQYSAQINTTNLIPIGKDDKLTVASNTSGSSTLAFYPLKGAQ